MKKKLIICTLCSVLIPLMILVSFASLFKSAYMDPEYPMFKAQLDYIHKRHSNDVIILGDSRAKSGFVPSAFPVETYNLSLGGTTPIEMYYTLKKYTDAGNTPQTVIIAFAPQHFYRNDCFWERTVYFHYLTGGEISEVLFKSEQYGNSQIDIDHAEYHALQYSLYMPSKYGTAIANALFFGRYNKNKNVYNEVSSQLGYKEYGKAEGCSELNFEASEATFYVDRLTDSYLRNIIELCEEKDIKLIFEQVPMNKSSYLALSDSFKEEYVRYMDIISDMYPEISVHKEIRYFDDGCFGDNSHLNKNGALLYTELVISEYLK
ncbi:MAG: hypothetical protein E7623_05430 [Ruminococcaceae bacterium]|nr:hypothetical protein [Oscillospiraceae bacterium]